MRAKLFGCIRKTHQIVTLGGVCIYLCRGNRSSLHLPNIEPTLGPSSMNMLRQFRPPGWALKYTQWSSRSLVLIGFSMGLLYQSYVASLGSAPTPGSCKTFGRVLRTRGQHVTLITYSEAQNYCKLIKMPEVLTGATVNAVPSVSFSDPLSFARLVS
jgi:hypothetical protein